MTYRDNGAIGALLDEYERAIIELELLLDLFSQKEFEFIADPKTSDKDCRSIQTVITHVVNAGYNYAIAIRNSAGENLKRRKINLLSSVEESKHALKQMFEYHSQVFDDYPDMVLEEMDSEKKILVAWGQKYDVEQLWEHAIVHILRHRRQIERFSLILNP